MRRSPATSRGARQKTASRIRTAVGPVSLHWIEAAGSRVLRGPEIRIVGAYLCRHEKRRRAFHSLRSGLPSRRQRHADADAGNAGVDLSIGKTSAVYAFAAQDTGFSDRSHVRHLLVLPAEVRAVRPYIPIRVRLVEYPFQHPGTNPLRIRQYSSRRIAPVGFLVRFHPTRSLDSEHAFAAQDTRVSTETSCGSNPLRVRVSRTRQWSSSGRHSSVFAASGPRARTVIPEPPRHSRGSRHSRDPPSFPRKRESSDFHD